MKKFDLFTTILFILINAVLYPILEAKQTLFTAKLKNNRVVDIIKLDPEDLSIFTRAKDLFMRTFLEVYGDFTAEQFYLKNKPGFLRKLIESDFVRDENDFNNKKDGSIFVVAMDIGNNEIIGFAAYDLMGTADSRITYIRRLAIDSAYRKQGLGTALIFDTIRAIVQNQPILITVYTRKINTSGINFYRKLGFQDAPMKDIQADLPEYQYQGFKRAFN